MAVSYIIGGGGVFEPPGMALYEKYPQMRNWSGQVVEWTGDGRAVPEGIY